MRASRSSAGTSYRVSIHQVAPACAQELQLLRDLGRLSRPFYAHDEIEGVARYGEYRVVLHLAQSSGSVRPAYRPGCASRG